MFVEITTNTATGKKDFEFKCSEVGIATINQGTLGKNTGLLFTDYVTGENRFFFLNHITDLVIVSENDISEKEEIMGESK